MRKPGNSKFIEIKMILPEKFALSGRVNETLRISFTTFNIIYHPSMHAHTEITY